MLLRDPVHGLVSFEADDAQLIGRLLQTREVQRLRRIRQLGLTSLVFPGAEHSRFAHALGTAHVMSKLMQRFDRCAEALPTELRLDGSARRDALAGALLHDIGHGAFSHLFEDVVPNARRHEDWGVAILLDPSSEVHRALHSLDAGFPARVADLLRGRHPIPYLGLAVSGALDVDRCDYLLRDSYMTGARYGVFDLDWLFQALTLARLDHESQGASWVLAIDGRKGLPPIEGFFLARHFMFQQVYHHKATRGAECLTRALFIRLSELIRDGGAPISIPKALRHAVLGHAVSVDDYVALDDDSLFCAFADWQQTSDTVLRDLVGRWRARQLFKTLPLSDDDGGEALWQEAFERAKDVVGRAGFRPDLYVWLDIARDVPYREGGPSDPAGATLWVKRRHKAPRPLSELSFLLRQLRNKEVRRARLVVPEQTRSAVAAAVETLL